MGNLSGKTDPNDTSFTYSYNERNLLTAVSAVNGGTTQSLSYRYDEAGSLVYASAGGVEIRYNGYTPGTESSYSADPYGRVLEKRTVVNGTVLEVGYGYDAGDRISSLSYPNGQCVSYSYNVLGDIKEIPGYSSGTPVYEGDLLKQISAANGVVTTFGYDDASRYESISYSGIAEYSLSYGYEYDDAGNIHYRSTNDGKQNEYLYDGLGRLKAVYLQGRFTVRSSEEAHSTGAVREDLFGSKKLSFDLSGQTRTVEGVEVLDLDFAAGSIGVDLKEVYDISRITLTALLTANRVTAEAIRVFVSDTNAAGSYSEVSDFQARYVTEEGIRKLELKFSDPNKTVSGRYLKVKTDYHERDASFNLVNAAEFYNNAESLIEVFYTSEIRNEGYSYSATGNRLSESVTMRHTDSFGYTHYSKSDRVLSDGRWAYRYDANGNRTAKSSHVIVDGLAVAVKSVSSSYWQSVGEGAASLEFPAIGATVYHYGYDLFSRLVSVEKNGAVLAQYTYDPDGLRVARTATGETSYYAYSTNGKLLYQTHAGQYRPVRVPLRATLCPG